MKLKTREVAIFGMLGALMYASKVFMELLPNVHLLGVFTISFTLVYRKKALYPIYTYVLLNGLFTGFATWWIPYLYLWTILWGVTMLLPRKIPANCVYGSKCMSRIFVWNTLCPGAGNSFWTEF